jgi:chemotaxis-related protein WspD
VPHRTGGLFDGIVNIRGDLQLCVSLARLLGIPSERPKDAGDEADSRHGQQLNRMIVVHQGLDRWVFPVDEVSEVHRVPTEKIVSPPATVKRSSAHIARGVFSWKDKQVGCLDASRLFASLADAISPQSFAHNG